ncbi:hypothetical protein [Kaistella palustris]|uniref:hypothetical protein n=1 Tax=Kaistella palustris TaxID=493376 RepID=UPI00042837E4|nr:hypothetical protein [Kaistella palustris]
MKSLLPIFSLLFSAVVLWSCEPGRDENGDFLFGVDPGSGGTPVTASRLLKKMSSHELNEDTGEWEDSDITYNYTDRKLVSYTENGGEPTVFTYNANNRISGLSNSGQSASFEYSGSTLSKIVTTIPEFATITSDFTYTNAQLTKTVSVQEYTFPVPSKLYIETTYAYTGANMTTATVKSGMYVNGELQLSPEIQVLTFEYDTKKSPYQLLPREFILFLTGIGPQGAAYLSANNFTKFTSTVGPVSDVSAFTYTYDSQNYPTLMKGPEEETVKFEYQ